jgi:hypothetical protein
MRVIANRQLAGHYGVVTMGQEFDADDDVARQLLRAGLVRKPDPPVVVYETKVILPAVPEAAPRDAFRDMSLSDEEPTGVAAGGDPVLSTADVSQSGTADPRGRIGRKATGPERRSTN